MVSLTIIAGAAGLLLRGKFRQRRLSFLHDTHCGCAAAPETGVQHSIVFRARKGKRPEIVVKMR